MQRKKPIDVLKGILILMVVFGHIVYAISKFVGCDLRGFVYNYTQIIASIWIAPYYMAAFFCITGYCSSFDRSWREQIVADLRKLVIPAIIIPLLMACFFAPPMQSVKRAMQDVIHLRLPWFLIALFLSKQMFLLVKMSNVVEWVGLIFLSVLSFAGCYMLNYYSGYNFIGIFHAMAFTLFVAIGHYFRKHDIKTRWIWYAMAVYLALVCMFRHIGLCLPSLCAIITFRSTLWPVYVLLALSGTLIWFVISRRVGHSVVLEYLGKNSLVIYLTHFSFFSVACYFLKGFIQSTNSVWPPSLFVVLFMFVGAIIWSCMWVWLFNQKYFRWIIGK